MKRPPEGVVLPETALLDPNGEPLWGIGAGQRKHLVVERDESFGVPPCGAGFLNNFTDQHDPINSDYLTTSLWVYHFEPCKDCVSLANSGAVVFPQPATTTT